MWRKRGEVPQTPKLLNGSWVLHIYVGCVSQLEEEGAWLPEEAGLDEGSIVATFAEKEAGLYLDGVWYSFSEFLFVSDSVKSFCHSLEVSYYVFVVLRAAVFLELVQTASK